MLAIHGTKSGRYFFSRTCAYYLRKQDYTISTNNVCRIQQQICLLNLHKPYCTAAVARIYNIQSEHILQRTSSLKSFSRTLRGKPPASASSGDNSDDGNDGGSRRDDDGDRLPPTSSSTGKCIMLLEDYFVLDSL